MKSKIVKILAISLALLMTAFIFTACDKVWGKDETASEPGYHEVDGKRLSFTLEFRDTGSGTEISDGDNFAHATIDGALIKSWQIDCYGNTVYESVVKYFEDKDESITFRLSQHKFYMFHDLTLEDGTTYNLETVYVAADGKYAMCANYQSLFGEDGIAGTVDDLKVLVLVYKGWLY